MGTTPSRPRPLVQCRLPDIFMKDVTPDAATTAASSLGSVDSAIEPEKERVKPLTKKATTQSKNNNTNTINKEPKVKSKTKENSTGFRPSRNTDMKNPMKQKKKSC